MSSLVNTNGAPVSSFAIAQIVLIKNQPKLSMDVLGAEVWMVELFTDSMCPMPSILKNKSKIILNAQLLCVIATIDNIYSDGKWDTCNLLHGTMKAIPTLRSLSAIDMQKIDYNAETKSSSNINNCYIFVKANS